MINENDTVATEEIRYGDNDRLAARVAQMIDADLLILLSDVDGLYDQNPNKNKNAKKINEIFKINKKIEQMANTQTSSLGSGGMITKNGSLQSFIGTYVRKNKIFSKELSKN